jgi:heptose-I-phosphate ethanolaminephosphotransferase
VLGILITAPLFFIKRDKLYKAAANAILLILVLPFTLHLTIFKKPINIDAVQAVLATNSSETIDFIQTYKDGIAITIIFICIVICLSIYFRSATAYSKSKKKYFLLLLIPLFILLVGKSQFRHSVFAEIRQTYIGYKSQTAAYNDLNKLFSFDTDIEFETISLEHNLLFVIGESTSYAHMGCCGYLRPTNQFTDQLPFIRLKAVTTDAHTIAAIYNMLNVGSDSLPYILKKAGYYTFWLSTQPELGAHETPLTIIRNGADSKIFIKLPGNDEKIIPYVKEIFNNTDKPTAAFVHLEGTHLSYKTRYPKEYRYFNTSDDLSGYAKDNSKTVNDYDNAIRYIDFVLYELALIAQNSNALLVYLPDHGDEVYDDDENNFLGHHNSRISKYMAEVPFFILPPPNYNKALSYYINRKDPISINHTNYIVEDLLGVHPKGFSEQKNPLTYFNIDEITVGGKKYAEIKD